MGGRHGKPRPQPGPSPSISATNNLYTDHRNFFIYVVTGNGLLLLLLLLLLLVVVVVVVMIMIFVVFVCCCDWSYYCFQLITYPSLSPFPLLSPPPDKDLWENVCTCANAFHENEYTKHKAFCFAASGEILFEITLVNVSVGLVFFCQYYFRNCKKMM